ncbi:MAG: RedB protein [Planctomycetes bacterium]|nr:RedB protein [Planctomycetota bacterium]
MMFIHPKCPCNLASLEEFARILARCKSLADMYAVFVRPPGVGGGWEKSRNWATVAAIPEIHMAVDENGVEARRFGATTSGHVQLYDAEGNLKFTGGITGARGHAGDNAGADAVRSWLRRGFADLRRTVVFGCPLFSPPSDSEQGDVGCQS